MRSLGIDVGGANLKVAGDGLAEIVYFPMWRRASELETVLKELAARYGADRAGVVITAELADVFESKDEGVSFIAKACRNAFGEVYFLDVDGEISRDVTNLRRFAASNWVASAKFLLKEGFRNFLLVDIGSTTADFIPVTDRIEAARTDYERMRRGELIYFGILRTPVFYVLPEFEVRLASEFFAITADVFVVTGDIEPEDYNCDTPDGAGKDYYSCLRRLARLFCADLEEIGEEKLRRFAEAVRNRMVADVSEAVKQKISEYGLEQVLGCGIGEFVIREACELAGVDYTLLSDLYGEYSKLFPAFAMFKLVEKL
ncbi:MAG: hydantoinase/oxoprolinase family protein [Archaeoglobaceae archaeon]